MSILTQGTALFVLIPGSSPQLVDAGCVTSITGVGAGAADQIDVTCLKDLTDRQFKKGLASPSAVTMNLNYDPKSDPQQQMLQLKESGETVRWFIGLSDFVTPSDVDTGPTLTGDTVTFPTTRSFMEFSGYVSEFPFDFSQNAVVTTAVTVQRSGAVVFHLAA